MFLNTEIDMEHAWFTHNIPDLDSTLFGRKKANLNDSVIVSSNFQFSPKNQKKLSGFLNEFTEAKNQLVLSESPAKLIFKQEDKYDIFFHIFETKDQIQWESKSQVLIVYIEDNAELKDHIDILSQYAAIAVVQGRSNTFRFLIGTKNNYFSDVNCPCFESGLDLIDIGAFSKEFNKASKKINKSTNYLLYFSFECSFAYINLSTIFEKCQSATSLCFRECRSCIKIR